MRLAFGAEQSDDDSSKPRGHSPRDHDVTEGHPLRVREGACFSMRTTVTAGRLRSWGVSGQRG